LQIFLSSFSWKEQVTEKKTYSFVPSLLKFEMFEWTV
jgi:hypothetical protein